MINPNSTHLYTKKGKKKNNVNSKTTNRLNNTNKPNATKVDPTGFDFSISKIMKLQSDFMNEITLLQNHRIKMGVIIDRSSKYHQEIAGEGIEYDWGLSKLHYRRNPLKYKRSKEKFHSLVEESTNPKTVLNIQHIRS